MSTRNRLLGDERGQSIVFVVLAMFALVSVLALVVDVGLWMRTHEKAQSVADAVALAAAQDLPSRTAASSTALMYTSRNGWSASDVSWSFEDDDTTIEVVAEQAAPGLFSRLVGVFNFTIGAEASARIEAPTELIHAAPLALECSGSWCNPNSIANQTRTFAFRDTSPHTQGSNVGFGPFRVGGEDLDDLERYLSCDPVEPGPTCWSARVDLSDKRLMNTDENDDDRPRELYEALRDARNDGTWLRLVVLYDDYDSGSRRFEDIEGWAAFSITNVTLSPGGRTVRITGTFRSLLVEGAGSVSDDGSDQENFGVRAVALTD